MVLNSSNLFNHGLLEQDTGLLRERWDQEGSELRSAYNSGNAPFTLLSVSAGKKYYLKSVIIHCTTANQGVVIRDGATNKLGIQTGPANEATVVILDCPITFTSSVYVWGGYSFGITITGWEEKA